MTTLRRWALATAACAVLTMAPAEASAEAPSHHRGDTFQNTDGAFQPRGLADVLRWRWNAWRDGLPPPPSAPTPRVAPDLAFLHANARAGAAMQPCVTWIGHATVLAQLGGITLLTDPIFSERASPVQFAGPKRAQPPGIELAQLPHVDLVLISHNHYDHLDVESVKALAAQPGGPPLYVVPLGNEAWFAELGITAVVELDWWQQHALGAVEVVMTPVQHWSGRGLADRMKTLWGGYAVFAPEAQLYFAGDTGYTRDFSAIRERFAPRQRDGGFDIALVPIGAYEPRWFMQTQHVDPQQAVQVHRDLNAKASLGIHWGTFNLTDEALDAPPRALAAARQAAGLADNAFFVLAVGETRLIPRRPVSMSSR